jgi:hypothetical protein
MEGQLRCPPRVASRVRQGDPRRVSLQVLGDTIQPFPSFSEIQRAALKALRREIETARSKVSAGTR